MVSSLFAIYPSLRAALVGAAAGFSLVSEVRAGSDYSLFNPVPVDHMRELNTDRPDLTESPFTVDAGHFQIEMDLANYTRDHDKSNGSDTRTDAWSFAPVNLKLGLTPDIDLQVVI